MISDDKLSEIARRIVGRLRDLGLSSSAASGDAGLSKDAIRNILRDPTLIPRGSTLIKLSKVLQVTPNWLLTGEASGKNFVDKPNGIKFGGRLETGVWRNTTIHENDYASQQVPIGAHQRYPIVAQRAYLVCDGSMDRAQILKGMWILAIDVSTWEEFNGDLNDGRIVVVHTSDCIRSELKIEVRRVRFFRDRSELQCDSNRNEYAPYKTPRERQRDFSDDHKIVAVVVAAGWSFE